MNKAEYLSVLVSIVVGMGVSHILSGVGRIMAARHRVRVYWVSLSAAAVTFLGLVQFWWSTWEYDEGVLDNFFSFLVFLLTPILLYLLAVLVFPDFDDDVAIVSMRDHYYTVRPWYFGVGAAMVLSSTVRNVFVERAALWTEDRPFECAFLVLMGVGLFARSPRVHAALAVAIWTVFLAMVVLTSLQPG
jgi:cytochrome bd-type quinol oxidase subunit 2